MKIIRYIAAVILLGVVGSSCSLLDIQPDGRETLKEIFADHDKTAAYLNSCYMNIPEKGATYDWVCNAPTALSDEGYLTYGLLGGTPKQMYEGSATATSHPLRDFPGNYYSTYMWQLRQCTIFLQNIDGAAVHTEQERARWRAEAHALRGYFMSELLKWFGAFAYEPDGFPDNYDYTKLRKRTVWELAEQIDAECTAAINTPELPWRIDQPSERKRMTKAVAWCIKSKMYLFAASPIHSEDYTAEEKAQHWEVAYQTCKQAVTALEGNTYALKTSVANTTLYTGPAAAYQELFTASTLTSADDPETIWQGTGAMNLIYHNYIGSHSWLNATRAGVVPTQEMVDAYDVTNAARTVAEPLLNASRPYNADKSPNYNPAALTLGFDPQNPYAAPRDPRMGVCVITNGDPVVWNGKIEHAETFVGGDNGISEEALIDQFSRTGYYFRKYVAPTADASNGIVSAPWKYFRLAEIKLNLAEAAAEANHLDEAKTQVDAIRNRVGMPDLPSGLSQAALILRVHQERMVELVYEECRYFDVRRWAESYQSSPLYADFKLRCRTLTAMWITKNEQTGALTYERRANLTNLSTKPRDLLLPIPETEAQTLYSLTTKRWQNAGW
ncbi:MAG: RagB/SusD family nutrient uptake outer membrane protein [Alistipes sp.]